MGTLNIAPRIDLLANERGRSIGNEAPSSSWVHVLPHLDPVYGGLSAVVPRLASHLYSQQRVKVRLAAFLFRGRSHTCAAARGCRQITLAALALGVGVQLNLTAAV